MRVSPYLPGKGPAIELDPGTDGTIVIADDPARSRREKREHLGRK